jgi:membrane AbrB-like protein
MGRPMSIFLLLVSAAAGGLALQRLPGGLVLGGMVGAAAYSLARGGSEIVLPGPLRTATFLVLGAAIGASVTRETVGDLRAVLLPAVLAAVLIIVAGVAIAYLLQALGLAPPAAVLATSPGALSAMSAVAAERTTAAAEVAIFHTVRLFLVLLTLPGLIALLPADNP